MEKSKILVVGGGGSAGAGESEEEGIGRGSTGGAGGGSCGFPGVLVGTAAAAGPVSDGSDPRGPGAWRVYGASAGAALAAAAALVW